MARSKRRWRSKVIISLIAACDRKRVIGRRGKLPWKLPADLTRFYNFTIGKPVVMGRKTWDSLPKKPLPYRINVVLTRDPAFKAEGGFVAHSQEEVLKLVQGHEEVMVAGGAEVFALFLPLAQRMYLTIVERSFRGEVFFPEYKLEEWEEIRRTAFEPDKENRHPYTFIELRRRVLKNPADASA